MKFVQTCCHFHVICRGWSKTESPIARCWGKWNIQIFSNIFLVGDVMLHFLMVNVIFQTFTLPYFNVFHYTATNPMLLTKQKILKKKSGPSNLIGCRFNSSRILDFFGILRCLVFDFFS